MSGNAATPLSAPPLEPTNPPADFVAAQAGSGCDFKALVEGHGDGMLITDDTGTVLYANPAAARMLGRERTEMIGSPLGFPAIDGHGFLLEMARTAGPASILWSRTEKATWHGGRARLVTLQDVTAREQAEESRRAGEAELRLIAERMPCAVWTTDRQLRVGSLSGAALGFLHHAPGEIVGQSLYALLDSDRPSFVAAARHVQALAGEPAEFEIEVSGRLLDCRVEPLRDGHGAVIGCVGSALDVTDRRALEEQLRQVRKLDAIGLLAGGATHDFNNLIAVINGYCSRLLRRLDLPEAARRELAEIGKAGERAGQLTRQLLAFGRQHGADTKPLDLNAAIGRLREMLQRMLGEAIDLVVDCAPELDPVQADSAQIERVIVNLAANARDAMGAGGRLTVATRQTHLAAAEVRRLGLRNSGPWAVLTVSDTGCGMSEAVRERLFEPFFTTKAPGQGTGLGLPTVHRIVKQAGGAVDLDSEPGQGSTFRIYLPIAGSLERPGEEAPASDAAPGGTETVLLVEDEEELRELIRQELAGSGYRVLSASDGHEALVACERYRAPVPLLITDVAMPRIRGPELFERLRQLFPSLKVVYISGRAGPEELGGRLAPDSALFLAKPFPPGRLLRAIRELLGPAAKDPIDN